MLEGNEKTALGIESRYYFKPIKEILEENVRKFGEIGALDSLTEVMRDARPEVEKIVRERKYNSYIEDVHQARRSVAGNGFQGLVAYSLIRLQKTNKLNPNLVIALKFKRHPLIEKWAITMAGGEVQKPNTDMLIYMSTKPEKYPVVVYSIKTSPRKRLGQTYIWKLLMDIVTSDKYKTIKDKYDPSYEAVGDFKVGLITANFRDEIMKPQQRGMLKFFDFAYVTKSGDWRKPMSNFSEIVHDLDTIYE